MFSSLDLHPVSALTGAPPPALPDAWAGSRRDERRVEAELRRALEAEEFVLLYQPRVCLRTGRLRGAEALIRWPHRRRGLVPPDAFLPVAERSGLISDLGGWVLRTACAAACTWPDEEITVSVNVSARQLQDRVLLAQVAEALDRSDLPPERLELELTDAILADPSLDTLLALAAVRDLGVGLALDDFGVGAASLPMLKRLPLTAMKLDRSLVRNLPADREDAAIVRAVVETGRALALHVVAEGVETEAQRAFLDGIGCPEAEGQLFSYPLPADVFRSRVPLWRA